jgi:hypothetical protein
VCSSPLFLAPGSLLSPGRVVAKQVLAVKQLRFGHIDAPLVVSDRHGSEVMVWIASYSGLSHSPIYRRHPLIHQLLEGFIFFPLFTSPVRNPTATSFGPVLIEIHRSI